MTSFFTTQNLTRRNFLAGAAVGTIAAQPGSAQETRSAEKAQIAITFDLEMSRMYPRRDMLEWDYQKGNLNEPTKKYSLEAARIVKERGAVMHFFCVGRVLEQPDVEWLKQISQMGHAVGNHTYDHVNVWATKPEQTQFRFQRSPWLITGKSAREVIQENIRVTTQAMRERVEIDPVGFRTPGGSSAALVGREDIQQMILDEGFTWVSSKYAPHKSSSPGEEPADEIFASILNAQQESQPFVYPTGLIEIPMSPISDVGAFRTSRWKLEHFHKSIRLCIAWAIEHKAVFDLLCHPSIMYVEDPEFQTVKLICDLVKQAGDKAELTTLGQIAKRVSK